MFKLTKRQKKSMFILALISFVVWFINPLYASDFFSIIVIFIIEMDLSLYDLWALSWPFIGILINCSLYYSYLKIAYKKKRLSIGIILLIIILLPLFVLITFWEKAYLI